MTGCRHNAKNTLVKNYLYLAEKNGAEIHPAHDGDEGPAAAGRRLRRSRHVAPTARFRRAPHDHRRAGRLRGGDDGHAEAAAPMRTSGVLPNVSDRLGLLTRTNSEALLGAIARHRDVDYSRRRRDHVVVPSGRAHPRRAGALRPRLQCDGRCCMTRLVPGDLPGSRVWPGSRTSGEMLVQLKRQRLQALRPAPLVGEAPSSRWSCRRTTTPSRPTPSAGGSGSAARASRRKQGHGGQNPDVHPDGHEAVQHMAAAHGRQGQGDPGGTIGEPFNIPMTAHFMGGCASSATAPRPASSTPTTGCTAIEGLHVVDGCRHQREPRRQPVADDHGAGRAGDSCGRTRARLDPVPSSGRPTAASSRCSRRAPIVPDDAPLPYGCRSSSQR